MKNFKSISDFMEYRSDTVAREFNNFIRINLSCGSLIATEFTLRVAILYDFDLILNTAEDIIREMKNNGKLNTGVIDLPCGFSMSGAYYTVSGICATLFKRGQADCANSLNNLSLQLQCINFNTFKSHTHEEIKEAGKRLFEIKMKPVFGPRAIKEDEIDWESCFDESSPDMLYNLFKGMQQNFMWMDIDNLIYVHSLFGLAYTNAVKRVSEYYDSNLARIHIPESSIVYDEFRKLLKKKYFNGTKIRSDIFICYVKDYISPNKAVE